MSNTVFFGVKVSQNWFFSFWKPACTHHDPSSWSFINTTERVQIMSNNSTRTLVSAMSVRVFPVPGGPCHKENVLTMQREIAVACDWLSSPSLNSSFSWALHAARNSLLSAHRVDFCDSRSALGSPHTMWCTRACTPAAFKLESNVLFGYFDPEKVLFCDNKNTLFLGTTATWCLGHCAASHSLCGL